MTKGRRPAGICGAALLLAARMNNFRRSVEEVVQVVKIADSTLRKRLEEFKGTRSGELTVADFRSVWLEEEMDPPAFVKGKEKEEREREEAQAEEGDEDEDEVDDNDKKGKQRAGTKRKKKKKRKRGEETEEEQAQEDAAAQEVENTLLPRQAIDPALLNEGILAGAMEPPPLFLPEDHNSIDANIDPSLLPPRQGSRPKSPDMSLASTLAPPPTDLFDESANTILAEEVANYLQNNQGTMLSSALDEAEERRLAQLTVVDDLIGLDEDELDRFLLSPEEVKIKERVWVELNKEYLEALAGESTIE
jgi:transcription factor IIIB 90 kDa subunit